jgi:hypothetical protein
MRKSTFKFSALLLFMALGTLLMGQSQFHATFNVDMSTAEGFDPATEDVYISGTFADAWQEPGSNADYKMTPTEEDPMIYTIVVAADSGAVQYKFFRLPEGVEHSWDYGEWAGDPNRSTILVLDNLTFDNIWGTKPFPVTFKVDVSPLDTLDPETDLIIITGSFASWAPPGMIPELFMQPDGENPGFYTLTLMMYAGEYQYKYFTNEMGVVGFNHGEWDGDPNRTITLDSMIVVTDLWGEKPSGIFDQQVEFSYEMYPNPVTDHLTVNGISDVNRIAIFDISGKMVKTIMVSGDKLNINVADLNSGIYLINFYNEKGVQTGKFVKK